MQFTLWSQLFTMAVIRQVKTIVGAAVFLTDQAESLFADPVCSPLLFDVLRLVFVTSSRTDFQL